MDPPLSIPNREVKRTYADGTDRPVGRVGSRRSSDPRTKQFARGSFFVPFRPGAQRRCAAPPGSRPPRLFPSAPRVICAAAFSLRDGERAGPCRQENGVPVPAFPVRQACARRGAPFAAPSSQRRGYLLSQLVGEQATFLFLADRPPRCPGVNGVISARGPFTPEVRRRPICGNGVALEITPFTPQVILWPSAAFLRARSEQIRARSSRTRGTLPIGTPCMAEMRARSHP